MRSSEKPITGPNTLTDYTLCGGKWHQLRGPEGGEVGFEVKGEAILKLDAMNSSASRTQVVLYEKSVAPGLSSIDAIAALCELICRYDFQLRHFRPH